MEESVRLDYFIFIFSPTSLMSLFYGIVTPIYVSLIKPYDYLTT